MLYETDTSYFVGVIREHESNISSPEDSTLAATGLDKKLVSAVLYRAKEPQQ